MISATPVRAGVSLDELLAAKERRAARQADMLEHYQQPVISLTLVTPGEIKDSRARSPVVRGPSGGGNQSALCGSGADAPARQAVGSGRDLPAARPRRASVAGGESQTLPDLRRARSRLFPLAKASC
ncbi:MAG: apo-citrate lyase phosphoribosyl-dephospho-CoA transferase [Enterobacter mori]|nr:apo-citrate lyase phosphoribosyl-dephospho-CoA transferase [Enterobacter mori]